MNSSHIYITATKRELGRKCKGTAYKKAKTKQHKNEDQ